MNTQIEKIIELSKHDQIVASCLYYHNESNATWEDTLTAMVLLLQSQKELYFNECLRLKSYEPIVFHVNEGC